MSEPRTRRFVRRDNCPFCGRQIERWSVGSSDAASADEPSCCALCYLAQNLDRCEIDREAVLIWLPEFTQGALNALVHEIHSTFAAHERPARSWLDRPPPNGPAPLLAAWSAYAALGERSASARERIGTASPRDLAEALALISPNSYARRAELLGGARLLPLGQFFVDGRDVYPKLLTSRKATGARNDGKVSANLMQKEHTR